MVLRAVETRDAPVRAAAYDQLAISRNACGPAALLTALRCGGEKWRAAESSFGGGTDKERLARFIARAKGSTSATTPGSSRWTRRGMSLIDLRDMANESRTAWFTPAVADETFFRGKNETPAALLARIHKCLEVSLAAGFPPVMSIRRHVPGKAKDWPVTESHFITILSVPRGWEGNAGSFVFRYADPWGGGASHGVLRLPSVAILPGPDGQPVCAEALLEGGWAKGKSTASVIIPAAALVVR